MNAPFLRAAAAIVAVVAALSPCHALPTPLTTAFNYQGQLKQNGEAVNGVADFEFTLWDSASGPSWIAGPYENYGVSVVNGVFTAQLDFGAELFNGDERWLEIAVRSPAGSGDFVPLTPRQRISAVPYALQTRGIVTNNAKDVGIGTSTPYFRLHVQGPLTGGLSTLYVDNPETFTDVPAVLIFNNDTNYYGIGLEAITGWIAIRGFAGNTDDGQQPVGSRVGVFGNGSASATSNAVENYGVWGAGGGVGANVTNYGIYGSASGGGTNWGGYFGGNVRVIGTLSKSAGSFEIDHPLDPENKILYHSFVESPDMMNIYNGNVVTDAQGYATITMPEWFEPLNRDFRYQLTVIDESDDESFVQVKVVRKMSGNQFTIRSSEPAVEVSWQVTGIRQDAFANANRIPVEVTKSPQDRGLYLNPEAFGLPEQRGMTWRNTVELQKAKRAQPPEVQR